MSSAETLSADRFLGRKRRLKGVSVTQSLVVTVEQMREEFLVGMLVTYEQ
jgi:hypothetical protein